MATPAGDAPSDTRQQDTTNSQPSLSRLPDLTVDAEPDHILAPRTEETIQQLPAQPKCNFQFDAVLLYASDDEDLAENIMMEMNELQLKTGKMLKVCCYEDPVFGASIVSRPYKIEKLCRFVFFVLKSPVHENSLLYTNEEFLALTKCCAVRERRIFRLYTKQKTKLENEFPEGLASGVFFKWYESEEKRHRKLLKFFETESDNAEISSTLNESSHSPSGRDSYTDTTTTNYADVFPHGDTEWSAKVNLVGCTNVNVTFQLDGRTGNVQRQRHTRMDSPEDRSNMEEDGPEETGTVQGQRLGGGDSLDMNINTRPLSLTDSESDEWYDAESGGDNTLVVPSCVSEDKIPNSNAQPSGLPDLHLQSFDEGDRNTETVFSGFRAKKFSKFLLRKSTCNTSEIDFYEKVVEFARSVGFINSTSTKGTAFRVGKDLIMTCWHVIRDIKDKEPSLSTERTFEDILYNNVNVWVQFKYKPSDEYLSDHDHRFLFKELKFVNEDLDFAIIELMVPEGRELPQAITRFSNIGEHNEMHLIGHDRGRKKELDPACRIETPTPELIQDADRRLKERMKGKHTGPVSEFYEGMAASGRIHFHCAFQKGASGSPGAVCIGDELYVVTMLSRGYPNFYYECSEVERENFGLEDKFFIEEGIDITAVGRHLSEANADLFQDVFGHS